MPKIKVIGQTVQTGERTQTNGRTHGRYQTYYRPCYAVNKHLVDALSSYTGAIHYSQFKPPAHQHDTTRRHVGVGRCELAISFLTAAQGV